MEDNKTKSLPELQTNSVGTENAMEVTAAATNTVNSNVVQETQISPEIIEQNQLLIDQFKTKRANYESLRNEEISKLIVFFKSNYESIDEISTKTLQGLFAPKTEDDNTERVSNNIMNKIWEYQYGIVKIDHIFKRNKHDDQGRLDTSLSISELERTKDEAKRICISMGIEKIRETSYAIKSVYKSFSEQNADFKIRYEIQKQFMANKYGYTPESIDEYFAAIVKYNKEMYNKVGSNVIKGGYVHSNEINEKYKHLLKVKEGWDGEEPVYVSELLKEYQDMYEKVNADRPKTGEGAELYNELLTTNRDLVIKHRTKLEKIVSNGGSKSNSESKSNGVISTDKVNERLEKVKLSLREQRKAKREAKKIEREKLIKESEHKEDSSKKIDYSSLVIENKPIIEEKKVEDMVVKEEEKPIVEEINTTEEEVVIKPTPEELKKQELLERKRKLEEELRRLEEIDKIKSELEELKEEEEKTDIKEEEVEVIEAPVVEDPIVVEVEEEKRPLDYNFEDTFKKVEVKPNIEILRSNNPNKLKLYNESYKYGRILYLPYSGYEVLVKRIVDRAQLSYILDLLQTSKLVTDGTVEKEVMRVVYSNLEFFFDDDVSEIDFYKNLSIRDIPLLIATLALISQKEEEGRVLVDIDRLICAEPSCQKRINLKESIKIDLKAKFKEIYPIELYYSDYYKYKEAKYKNIYEAYSHSIDGKLNIVEYSEEPLKYKVIYGKTNFYNSSDIFDRKINDLIFTLYKEDLDSKTDEELAKEYPLMDVKEYLNGKLLVNLQLRYDDISTLYPSILEDTFKSDEEIEALEDEDYKEAIEEMKMLRVIMEKLDNNLNETQRVISVIANIRSLNAEIIETGEKVFDNLDSSDLYTLFNTVINAPNPVYKKILDLYAEQQEELNKYDYRRTFIKVSSNEIKGKIDKSSVLKPRDEFIDYINSKYEDEKTREIWIQTYDDSEANVDNGLCTCSSHNMYINHFNLLFFSIISQMGVRTKVD